MRKPYMRIVALALLLCLFPTLSGCGGGIVETYLTVKKLIGVWQLYQLFNDGQPSLLQFASALLKLGQTLDFSLEHVNDQGVTVESETGTWDVENGVLVLNVVTSTVDPAAVGTTLRLPGQFTDGSANSVSITRPVTQGQVSISQEQVYQRVAN